MSAIFFIKIFIAFYSDNQEESQKFTFRSRGKGRNQTNHSKANRENQQPHGSTSGSDGSKHHQQFRSFSWQTFQINKKEVLDAVEKAWIGVKLSW